MLVRRFLDRLAEGTPTERAEIVRALVRVFLEAPLDAENRTAAITAMTVILDDPAPRVRRMLATALADTPDAPRPIVLALSDDQPDVAEIILARSPVLTDSDLVDIIGTSGERQRTAIAGRPVVDVGVAAAIVELSGPEACLTLIRNPEASIAVSTFRRLVERHRKDAAIRSALLTRKDLPLTMRHALIDGLSEALGDLVRMRAWLAPERTERVLRDAGERAVVELSRVTDPAKLRPLVEQLSREGRLTPGLIIRAACAGNVCFFEESLSVLARMPSHRVASLIYGRFGTGFDALYRRTGMPARALPTFRAIVETLHEIAPEGTAERGRSMVERVLTRYQRFGGQEVDEFFALLGRLAAEARRERARQETGGYFRAA
jgi:uncharacterized protein (DUF2336 family)